MSERKAMIKVKQELSVIGQRGLFAVPRSSAYARSQVVSESEIELMRQLHALYLQWPLYGSRRLCVELRHRGYGVNRKRVQRLMRKIGLRAIYPKPRTCQPGKGHKVYPYLLRGLNIERSNQVWASDICYIPMAKGFLYLTVIMDWHSLECWLGGAQRPWRPRHAWKRWKKHSAIMEHQKFSIPTRGHHTPARGSWRCSKLRECRSVWMGKVGGSTISLWNVSGGA